MPSTPRDANPRRDGRTGRPQFPRVRGGARAPLLLLFLTVLPHFSEPAYGGVDSLPSFNPRAEGFPFAGRQLEAVIDALERRTLEAPLDADAWARLGLAYAQRGTIEGRVMGVRRIEHAMELAPDNAEYALARGFLQLRQGFEHYARDAFEEAELLAPADFRAPLEVGQSYLREWRELRRSESWLESAERAFDRTLRLRPTCEEAAIGLAIARRAAGDPSGAEEAIKRAWTDGASGAWLDLVGGLLAYEAERPEEARTRFERGLAHLPPEERAVFEDVTPLLSLEARADFAALGEKERYHARRRFWREVDPSPATERNERQLEHWGRVVLAELYFAVPSLGLRGWDTDRGLALIRYGEPAVRAYEPGEVGPGGFVAPFVFWHYQIGDASFDLAFEDRGLHGEYRIPLETKPGGWAEQAALVELHWPQITQWTHPGVDLPLPVAWYRLRGEESELEVALAYELPSRDIPWQPHGAYWELDGQRRLAVYDELGDPLVRREDDVRYRARPSLEAAQHARHAGAMLVPVAPGGRLFALEVEEDSRAVRAGWSEAIDLVALAREDAAADAPVLSDIVLARDIRHAAVPTPAEVTTPFEEGALRRGDLRVEPIAERRFTGGERAFLYYEIYDLALESAGDEPRAARYDVTYRIEAVDQPQRGGFLLTRWARRLLGVERHLTVTYRFERSTVTSPAREQLELDVRSLPPGRYRVRVEVEDRVRGASASRESEFTVAEAKS